MVAKEPTQVSEEYACGLLHLVMVVLSTLHQFQPTHRVAAQLDALGQQLWKVVAKAAWAVCGARGEIRAFAPSILQLNLQFCILVPGSHYIYTK